MNYLFENTFLFLVIILSLFLLVFLLRIFRFIYNFIRCLYLSYKYKPKHHKETYNKKYAKPDTPLERNKKAELQLKEDLKRLSGSQELIEKTETQIVGIAEPVGMWTEFVTRQKLSWLKAMIGSKAESDKFWQNIVQAQEKAQGKKKGRGR